MSTDSIADMLAKLRNAGSAGKSSVLIPHSNILFSSLSVLQQEGFVGSVEIKNRGGRRFIEVELNYDKEGKPTISSAKRVSKQSLRVYKGFGDIRPVRGGLGRVVISTPKGVLSGDKAKQEKVGGEVLFEIW